MAFASLPADRIGAEVTTLALCWRIVRRDGVALGFTTHDRPLLIDGLDYASAPGIAPSAVVVDDGLEVDTLEVAGALSSDAITAADLIAGRYDGASLMLFLVDWQAPAAGIQPLARGTLGSVEHGTGPDAGFSATLRGPTAVLTATRIETYSPECRAELGDARCRVAMRGRVARGAVTAGDGASVTIAGIAVDTAPDQVEGRLRLLSGPLAGVERRIIASDAARLICDAPLAVAAGTLVEVRQGCDKRFATCAGRFANAANFRGEPHVPGGDVLTRFPGA